MPRRSPSLFLLLALAGCTEDVATTASPRRVDAVAAPKKKGPDLDAFCEVRHDAATAPMFSMPHTDVPSEGVGSGWTWVNVWATWCGPCVEEMPRLRAWVDRFAKEGAPFSLRLLSVDENAAVIPAFREKHKDWPASPRLADFRQLPAFLASAGLDQSAALPLHLFIDAKQRLRCVRVGAVEDHHAEAIKAVLSQP